MANSIVNPPSKYPNSSDINDKNSAGNVIAAGIGTAVVLLTEYIPDPSFAKKWLIASAPTVSIFSLWLWKTLMKLFAKTKRYLREKTTERSILIEINNALIDPLVTDEEREKLRQERLKLRLGKISSLNRKLRILRKEQ